MSNVAAQPAEFRLVKLADIRENEIAVRTEVDKSDIQYQELVNAIRTHGFTSAIWLEWDTDPVTGEKFLKLLDGLQRFTAATELGITEVPALITSGKSESQLLAAQMMMNVTGVEMKPVDIARGLKLILQLEPSLTAEELGDRVGKSKSWVEMQLKLNKLDADIQKLVNDGKLTATNAATLATLPVEKQPEYLQDAMTLPPNQFGPKITEVIKELRAAARAGRVPVIGFKALPTPRKLAEFKAVNAEVEVGNMETLRKLIAGITDPLEAAKITFQWAIQLDPESVAMQKLADEQKKAAAKARQEQLAAERQAIKDELAARQSAAILNKQTVAV